MPLIERYVLQRARLYLLSRARRARRLAVGHPGPAPARRRDRQGPGDLDLPADDAAGASRAVQVVAPIAFLAAAILTLNGLTNDSELPVIAAAGASRSTINRPILVLGLFVMLAVAFSYHVLAPASLAVLRELVTRVRADVIATLVQDGGFRTIDNGLTMHIREKAPDGSFRDIFVSDDRNPKRSLQYSAAHGLLLERRRRVLSGPAERRPHPPGPRQAARPTSSTSRPMPSI